MKTFSKINYCVLTFIFFNFIFPFSSLSQVSLTLFADSIPYITDIKNAGDDRLFIVQETGQIRIVDRSGNVNPVPFLNIQSEVLAGGEQGLLGLAFSPDYKNDGRFYVYYTGTGGGHTHISRFHVSATNPDSADASSEELLIFVLQPFTNHNGGCLQFGNDGYLYCSFGDGGSGGDPYANGQNRKDTLGNILRIDVSPTNGYTIPGNNPFVNDTSANHLIWSYGLRNPWRFSFDRLIHDLWIGDVGQNAWEEIDFQSAQSTGGENYGWRCYEGNHIYNTTACAAQSNFVFPVYEYTHSTVNGCSVTGGYVYRGGKYAAMFGKYFFADYCTGLLQSLKKNPDSSWAHYLEGDFNDYDFGTFGEDRFGELYIGGFTSGNVYKIKNGDCTPTAYIYDKDTLFVCGDSAMLSTPLYDSLQYEWFYNDMLVAEANSNTLLTKQNGWYRVRVTAAVSSCTNTSTDVYVLLSATENISIAGLPTFICNNYYPTTLRGSPVGGYFSGDGIFGTVFYPDSVFPGDHLISYNYLTSYGCSIRKKQTINVADCISGSPVLIAPNPAAHNLLVDFSFNENEVSEITIYNASGKLCLKENLLIVYGTMQHTFNIANLASGVYTFQLKNSTALIKEKFVIEKTK